MKKLIIVFVITFIFYSQNLFADFVYDDRPAILENHDVLSKTSWREMLLENDFWGNPIKNSGSHKSWRPLTVITFRIQMAIHGKNPFWFHLINILLHATNSCLVAVLARETGKLKESKNLPLFCALIFCLHPINTEAVCSIVGRADLLATFFILLGLVYKTDPFIFALLGLASKETAIILLPILMAQNLLSGKKSRKNEKCLKYLFYLGFLIYLRLSINNFESPKFSKSDNPIAYEPSIWSRFLTFFYLPVFHFSLIVFPKNLCFDWQIQAIRSIFDTRFYISIIFYFSLLTFFKVFKSHRFLIILLCAPHLISSNILTYVGFVAAERILYLPTVSFSILLANSLLQKYTNPSLILLVLAIFGARTVSRIGEWQNEEALFNSALSISPLKAHANLGHIQALKGHKVEAKQHYSTALKLRPTMADVWYNLGILTDDQTASIGYYKQAITYRPNFAAAYLNLGLCYWAQSQTNNAVEHFRKCQKSQSETSKNYRNQQRIRAKCAYNEARINRESRNFEKSIENLETALEYQPEQWELSTSIWNLLGDSWTELGDFEKAETYFELSMRSDPFRVNSLVNWGKIRIRQNRSVEAEELFEIALKLQPNSSDVLYSIGWTSQQMGDFNRSISFYRQSLRVDPNHLETLEKLANLLQQLGKNREAEECFERIVRRAPSTSSAWTNYGAILHVNKKYDRALEMYEMALKIDPNNRITRENRLKLLRILGKKNAN